MTYQDHCTEALSRGFLQAEITPGGFQELTDLGFTSADCLSIEMDLQAGFTLESAISALHTDTELPL